MKTSSLETILFVAGKPLSETRLAKVLDCSKEDLSAALLELTNKYQSDHSGIWLVENAGEWQLISNPHERTFAEQFVKSEIAGELTRPQLETLTVISYCGPINKPELEQIRGVNCSLILRNLLLRGLIAETNDASALLPTYSVTHDYLRFLGLTSVTELPNYAELSNHQNVRAVLAAPPEKPL